MEETNTSKESTPPVTDGGACDETNSNNLPPSSSAPPPVAIVNEGEIASDRQDSSTVSSPAARTLTIDLTDSSCSDSAVQLADNTADVSHDNGATPPTQVTTGDAHQTVATTTTTSVVTETESDLESSQEQSVRDAAHLRAGGGVETRPRPLPLISLASTCSSPTAAAAASSKNSSSSPPLEKNNQVLAQQQQQQPSRSADQSEEEEDSDEEIIDLEIVVEGEEEMEVETVRPGPSRPPPGLTAVKPDGSHSPKQCREGGVSTVTTTTVTSVAPSSSHVPLSSSGSSPVGAGKRTKECAKVKQFFTTLQTFANNISHDVAEQVQELITALVNGLATVEEFHQEIQVVTNYPLKEFVIPFLKENLIYFQEELKDTKQVLSSIFGSAPHPEGPLTAPQYAEPELVIVPSTKPSAPPTTTTVITTPSSPLKTSSNPISMSAPPATIHEPPTIPPTRIETIPNVSAVRKRPRDLFTDGDEAGSSGSIGGGRNYSQGYGAKRVPKPIPTATLTPTQDQMQPKSNVVVESHPSLSNVPPSVPAAAAVTSSSALVHYSRPSSTGSSDTPPLREISPSNSTNISYSSNQKLLSLIKDDWNCLDMMMTAIEGMVCKTQRSLLTLKERVQLVTSIPSTQHLYKQFEQDHEPVVLQRIQQAVDEAKLKASEEKQRILLDASRQMREAIKEANVQSNSKENCWNCGRKATETCSGCSKARYCGTYCQHKDWDRHMKHCTGAAVRSSSREQRDHQVTVTHPRHRTAPLSHAPANVPTVNSHHIPNSHSHITMATSNSCMIKTTRTPTPTSYINSSELLVPLRTDPLANGTLTGTSNGVAVVTINRSTGDMASSGGNMM